MDVENREKGEIRIWGGVTNPRLHSDANFRYLVYGIEPISSIYASLGALSIKEHGYRTDTTKQSVNLFNYPEKLADRVSVSMSLIDPSHIITWGRSGLIIEAPEDNVLITSESDIGAGNSSLEFLQKQARDYTKLSGDQLLARTHSSAHNEVVAVGTTETGTKLKLSGFFAKGVGDEFSDPLQASILEQHAQRLGLPFVRIQEVNPFEQDSLELSQQSLIVNYGGKRYILGGGTFDVMNFKRQSQFVSPEELQTVLDFMRSQTDKGDILIDDKRIAQVKAEYIEHDKKRKAPIVKYDEHGNILRIEIRTGYGKQEDIYRISSQSCWCDNAERLRDAMRMSMSQGQSDADLSMYRRAVSIEELDAALIESLRYAELHVQEQVRSFYDKAKGAIQENFLREERMRPEIYRSFYPSIDFTKYDGLPLKIFPQDKKDDK